MPFLDQLPTILIIIALAIVVALAVRSVIRNKKKGGSCGCGCSSCPMSGSCHAQATDQPSAEDKPNT